MQHSGNEHQRTSSISASCDFIWFNVQYLAYWMYFLSELLNSSFITTTYCFNTIKVRWQFFHRKANEKSLILLYFCSGHFGFRVTDLAGSQIIWKYAYFCTSHWLSGRYKVVSNEVDVLFLNFIYCLAAILDFVCDVELLWSRICKLWKRIVYIEKKL